MSPPLKRGMTAAAFQSLGISGVAVVGVARRKAWPAVEKCFLKFSIIVVLSVVTVFPSLSAVGSWEEVLLFYMDFTVSLSRSDHSSCVFSLCWSGRELGGHSMSCV